jgi:hypothetical protein
MSDPSGLTDVLTRLDVLVGQWTVEASFEDTTAGTATIEWALGHRFLIWRVTIPDTDFPESLSVISANSDGQAYTQHYFDDRGLARLYKMTLGDCTWTLLRDEPDSRHLNSRSASPGRLLPAEKRSRVRWNRKGRTGSGRRTSTLSTTRFFSRAPEALRKKRAERRTRPALDGDDSRRELERRLAGCRIEKGFASRSLKLNMASCASGNGSLNPG